MNQESFMTTARDNMLQLISDQMSQEKFTNAANFGHALATLYLNSQECENSAISPISVFICMYMLKHGANGVTKAELEKALSIEDSNGQEAQDVIKVLTESSNSQFTMTTANGLFLQVKFDPVAEYVEYLKKDFSAHVQTVAFGTPAGEKVVNDWVKKETNGMITNLVEGTNTLTVLVLVNAVYMKGKWANPFKKKLTKVGDFSVSNTRTITANYMYQKSSFRYTRKEEEKFALCFLPYRAESRDTSWVMGILLPEKGLNVTEFLKYLEPKRLMNLHYHAHQIKLKVKLPKVKLEAKVDMIPFFKSLGVQAAFGMEADLTGISGNEDAYVSEIIQKCYVDIDEEGTEAAAATYVEVRSKCIGMKPKTDEFYVTSPYIYFIYHPTSGLVLFTGIVTNPSENQSCDQKSCSIS